MYLTSNKYVGLGFLSIKYGSCIWQVGERDHDRGCIELVRV